MTEEVDRQAVLEQAFAWSGTQDNGVIVEVDEVFTQAFEVDQIHFDGG